LSEANNSAGTMNLTSENAKPPRTWDIALSAWIIQDGNYPEFFVGQVAEFAVEFRTPGVARLKTATPPTAAVHRRDSVYDAVAEVVLRTDAITVLDVGVSVYRESSSADSDLIEGSRYALELELGVDPYFYFERLSQLEEVPPLIYSWRILAIFRQTAPFIDAVVDGRRIRRRDPQRLGFEPIANTDAWTDDDGHGTYILRCEKLAISPKRESATAT